MRHSKRKLVRVFVSQNQMEIVNLDCLTFWQIHLFAFVSESKMSRWIQIKDQSVAASSSSEVATNLISLHSLSLSKWKRELTAAMKLAKNSKILLETLIP